MNIPESGQSGALVESQGLIVIQRYEDNSQAVLDWIEKTMREQYNESADQPEYRHFLEGKFPFVKD